jgi:hypothetical protein
VRAFKRSLCDALLDYQEFAEHLGLGSEQQPIMPSTEFAEKSKVSLVSAILTHLTGTKWSGVQTEGIEELSAPIEKFLEEGVNLSESGAELLRQLIRMKHRLYALAGIEGEIPKFGEIDSSDESSDDFTDEGEESEWTADSDHED